MESGVEAGGSGVKSEEHEGDEGEGVLLPPPETEGEKGRIDLLELPSVLTASNEGEVVEEEVRAWSHVQPSMPPGGEHLVA